MDVLTTVLRFKRLRIKEENKGKRRERENGMVRTDDDERAKKVNKE